MPEAIGETARGGETETGGGVFEEGGTVESWSNTGDDDKDPVGDEEDEEEVENEEEESEDVSTATLDASDAVPSSAAFISEANTPSDFTISFSSSSFSPSFWLKSGSSEAETSSSIASILPEEGRGREGGSGRGRV